MNQDAYTYLSSLGATDDQIRQSMARYTQPQAQPQSTGNFFTHALPTIGGIAGGLVGLPTEALNAILPGSGIAANLALAGAGSAAGKGLENMFEGQSATKDLGSSFLQGAAGGLLGGVGGKVIGKIGSKVAGGFSKAAGNIADNQAAQAAADRLAAFKGVPTKIREGNNLNGVADLMDSVGVAHTPEAYRSAANAVTGPEGAVNGIKRQLVGQAGPVQMSGVMKEVEDAIKPNTILGDVTAKGSTANATRNWIRDELQQNIYGGDGSLTELGDPNEVFGLIQRIDKTRAGLGQGEQADALNNALGGVKQAIEKRLYGNAGADKAVANYSVTPEDLMAIDKATGGNAALTSHIVSSLNDAKSVSQLRGVEAPFVRASRLADSADKVAGGAIPDAPTGTVGLDHGTALAMAPMTHGLSLGAMVPKALKSEGFINGANNAMQGAGNIAGKVPDSVQGLLTSAPAQGLAHAQDFSSPDAALGAIAPPDGTVPPAPDPTTPAPDESPASGYTDSQLQEALVRDIQNTGGQHQTQIEALMKINASAVKAQNPPLSAVTKRMYSQVESAQKRLTDFNGLMNRVVNQSGPGALLTGVARSVAGSANLDTDAKAFNDTRQEMALSLARALSGGSTQGSEGMLKRIEGYIPKITDSKESAATKMKLLDQMLEDTKTSILSAPDYGTPSTSDPFASPQAVSFAQ